MSDFKIIPYDIDTIDSEIYNEIKNNPLWNDVYIDDPTLKMFVYIIKYYISLDLGTINNTFIDSFPGISNSSEVIYKFADFIGLPISGYVSSTGNVRFFLPQGTTATKQIIIYEGTEVKSTTGIVFSTTETVYINPGESEVTVGIIQGQYKSYTFNSSGEKNQFFNIDVLQDNNEMVLTVDGVEWERVTNFLDTTSDNNIYKSGQTKKGFYIQFGNGINAPIPMINSTIELKILETKGSLGKVYSTDLITKIIPSIYDSDNNAVKISVTNDDVILGGSDRDSVSLIKKNIPLYFSYTPYLYRKEDYENYLKIHPSILDCKTYAGFELYPNNPYLFTNIYFVIYLNSGFELTDSDKIMFKEYLNGKDFFMVNKIFYDVKTIPIEILIKIQFKDKNVTQVRKNEVKTIIDGIVGEYFDLQSIVQNGGTIYRDINSTDLSDPILNDITDLKKVNIIYRSAEIIKEINILSLFYSKALDFNSINLNEAYLYISDKMIGKYDEYGNLVVEDQYTSKIEATLVFNKSAEKYLITVSILDISFRNEIMDDNLTYPDKYIYLKSYPENKYDVIVEEYNVIPVKSYHSIEII